MAFGVCDFPGCTDPAAKRPVLLVPARPPRGTALRLPDAKPAGEDRFDQGIDGPTRYVVEYNVCQEFCCWHAEQFRPRTLIRDEATWSAIGNQLEQNGFAPPSPDDCELQWKDAAGEDGLDDTGRAVRDLMAGTAVMPKEERDRLRKSLA